jgi:1,4-dihydroxy-2-naphthoate octaprenyltransferase
MILKKMSQKQSGNMSTLEAWILATRPKTLPAAVAPVCVGSAMAFADQRFAFLPAVAALAVALLLQIGVNLANDYFDYVKGIDTRERLGPARVSQSGLIPSATVRGAMISILLLALIPGLYLAFIGGWAVIIIGIASIIAALAYSGGPFPLASHGLGDLFVFIFFGLVAVCGTYYVQALRLTPLAVMMGCIVGLMISAILVVNNLRDIHTDRRAGKRTLAVILGKRASKIEYTLLHACAYVLPIIIWLLNFAGAWILLPVLTIPLAVALGRGVWKSSGGTELNLTLAKTAALALVFSLLLSVGLILS